MAVETNKAVRRGMRVTPGKGDGYSTKWQCATIETSATASVNSTYAFFQVPSNARIMGPSTIYVDDLASSGSPVLDIGLFPVDGNITADDDAFRSGLDVFTAAANTRLITDVANIGKQAWEFVAGLTADPGGLLEIRATIKTAAINAAGTITLEVFYAQD